MDTSELKQPRYNERDPTPYQEGRAAYADGLDRGENPYDDVRQPRASEDWSVGWLDAEEEAADSGGLFGS
jgi:hypothetical protein